MRSSTRTRRCLPEVLAGVNQCIADGSWGMVQKVCVPSELLICGEVGRNAGIVKAIEAHLGKPAQMHGQPQYVRALGTTLLAIDWGEEAAHHLQ